MCFLSQKIVIKLWVGSGIRKNLIPDPGCWIHGKKNFRSRVFATLHSVSDFKKV